MSMVTTLDVLEGDEVETGNSLTLTESMGVSLARAEIDVQIATARRYPRSIANASKNIRDLVTMDKEAAAECMYALPRGGKPIQGPSIRFAEIIFQCWGNARCDARVVGVDRVEKVIVAEGIYHDLETNSAGRATVRRSIADRSGRIFKDDMIAVTGNAACSIAKRNAILAGVPKSVWNRAYVAARDVVAGTIKTLAVSRDQALAAFANFGVKPEQIFPAIGVGGLEDITLEHIPVLRGMFSVIKNGEATVEEMFAAPRTAGNHAKIVDPLKDEEPEAAAKVEAGTDQQAIPVDPKHDAAPERDLPDTKRTIERSADTTETEVSPREKLLADLRDALDEGARLPKLLNELGDRRDLLTEDDVKALRAREKKVQGGQG